MGDIFDQVAAKKPATGDIFDQVSAAPLPNAGLAPPAGAPPKDISSLASKYVDLGDEIPQAPDNRTALQMLKDSAMGPAMGAATIAPMLTAGASLPVQALVGAASGAAQSKLLGGSNKEAATSGAIGGALPVAAEGVGMLYRAAKNAVSPAIDEAKSMLTGLGEKETPNNLVQGQYSEPGNQVAASLRSNSRIDVPAEAHRAMPVLKEALADMTDKGVPSEAFEGRNGPATFQKTVDHAIDIQEARAKSVIDPIRKMQVDPSVLAENPELASRFSPQQIKNGVTYGDIDAERIAMNKQMRRANFYGQDLSKQYAAGDPLATIEDAVNQARSTVYDQAYKTTGVDLRPLKQQESALIKLGDVAETTKNTLSEQTAKQSAATPLQKLMGGVKRVVAIKANPTNAFEPGFTDPTSDFNRNMSRAFSDVKAAPGSVMKNGRLIEPGPGVLTHPNGRTPAAPNAQEPLDFGGGHHISAGALPDILGQALISREPFALGPPGDMPPELQRVLPYTNPGIRSDIFPGTVKKK